MKRSIIAYTVASFIVAGCAKSTGSESGGTGGHAPAGSAAHIENVSQIEGVTPAGGKQAPNFSWYDETGRKVTFSEFAKGHVVLLNFWATWCPPCRKELPDLIALSKEYKGKNAKLIGISLDQDANVLAMVHEFVKKEGISYPIVIDNGELQSAYGGIRGIPTTFYIDKNGIIVNRMVGLQSKETFRKGLDALLK